MPVQCCSILTMVVFMIMGCRPYEVAFEVPTSCAESGYAVASYYNCTFLGQIGTLNNSCFMMCSNNLTFWRLSQERPRRIRRNLWINWMERQVPLVRKKRDLLVDELFNDPEWKHMWYLNRNAKQSDLPDHNVTIVWQMGYTGKGVTITFLDDGLEYDHPDLMANYDPIASFDVNNNDSDPSPRYDPENQNKHGTRCAGEVAAVANNSRCIVGVAYNAKVGGIRMLDGEVSDRVEASSLSHRPDHVHIYSASWGPDDNGKVVDGPGRLARKAFEQGALFGRGGKGSIFVWASGNGGREGDSCACDGYINSIYTFAISATTEVGDKPWYQEECSGTLATTFSSGDSSRRDGAIITTDLEHGCTRHHTGTSASAPLAAAFIALVLEARPDLTWRDVMYICVLGSRPDAIAKNNDFVVNKAGLKVSNLYGFGLMDAGYMVYLALNWVLVPPMVSCSSEVQRVDRHIQGFETFTSSLHFDACRGQPEQVGYIEQVQILVTISCQSRGSLELYVRSPSGTQSKILPTRRKDKTKGDFNAWPFLCVQFWGEKPEGTWQLKVVNTDAFSSDLVLWQITVHGTREDAGSTSGRLRARSPSACHYVCDPTLKPCGPTSRDCARCKYYFLTYDRKCVVDCPSGWYPDVERNCRHCHYTCATCKGPNSTDCTTCRFPGLLVADQFRCSDRCPFHYFYHAGMRKCIRCSSKCTRCFRYEDLCTECMPGYILSYNKCIKSRECPIGKYFEETIRSCERCHPSCRSCNGSASYQCTSCHLESERRIMMQGECVSSCPNGYFQTSNLTCERCSSNCDVCFSESLCSHCSRGYILDDGVCCLAFIRKFMIAVQANPLIKATLIIGLVFLFIAIYVLKSIYCAKSRTPFPRNQYQLVN